MATFSEAAERADATGMPAAEGFAVEIAADAEAAVVTAAVAAALAIRFPDPGPVEAPENLSDRWWVFRGGSADLSFGAAWDAVRALLQLPGVARAEPLLLVRQPVVSGAAAQQSFRLWGRVSDARLAEIQAASDARHRHWSLVQMGVCDADGQGGAWQTWRARAENRGKEPGTGILVAHPDTGYTRHARLLPHLSPHADDPARFGRNFVERDAPDALDPMADRSVGNFPGHGTGTAGVLAAGGGPADQPWGVAPGAKILPLRVSSSVIHLSFQNLCDALVEAMDRGAHVISMSLGGPLGSGLLDSLIRRALDRGIVVVAAAGNYAPTVVFPARLPGVLACAASNALAAPWRFSGLGAEVAITAPGEGVWHDLERLGGDGLPVDDQGNGNGTSFATANVAGLAALWLSYHGRDALIEHACGGRPELLPFLFRLCLERSADATPAFIRRGKGGFGAGIARADRLLAEALPGVPEAAEARRRRLSREADGLVGFPSSVWRILLTLPTLTADGPVLAAGAVAATERDQRLYDFLAGDSGLVPAAAGGLDDADRAELEALAATDAGLATALDDVAEGGRSAVSSAAVRRYLLRREARLSKTLGDKLQAARSAAQKAWRTRHPEVSAKPYALPSAEEEDKKIAYSIAPPPTRRLRAFAFDPSLATRSAEAAVNEITIPVVFERSLEPGPVGDYLEVVDVDPASDCAYAPVDLNHPFLLAQDGLPRSEGNPQFHQQMVYAVAMKTIGHFEEALGRPIFWSPLRPWAWQSGDAERAVERVKKAPRGKAGEESKETADDSDQFVRRLRLYPHALREQNAYYSPQKRAILFGYFPAGEGDPGAEYPGGVVFTCLAHDIVAHETTHALLDGMHVYFTEPTNPDVLAFHEAFGDIVALFQRFTYAELLADQIARARGNLEAGTLMTRLALQFGQATGRHQPLRDALGYAVLQSRTKGDSDWRDRPEVGESEEGCPPFPSLADAARNLSDEETRRLWKRFQADPSRLAKIYEPHERGALLVAAVFDAYLRIYEDRVADLRRLATGGTGVLPEGELHPDLVQRMAGEAAKSARHVLRMCIRAMDYVPPTDITFGDFLRALITADSDLVPNDDRRYRVAFIEAFRKWGIYPRDVRTLSEETLRWSPPDAVRTQLFPRREEGLEETINQVRRALFDWQPGEPRDDIFERIKAAQATLWTYFRDGMPDDEAKRKLLGGIDTRRTFQVTNLRPARRIGPRGEFLTEMVVEILQRKDALPYDADVRAEEKARRRRAGEERRERGLEEDSDRIPFRGGVTLIVGMDNNQYVVRYAIYKRTDSAARESRQREFLLRARGEGGPDAAEYSSDRLPAGWLTQDAERERWLAGRLSDREDMRASSCACRRGRIEGAETKAAQKAARKAGIPLVNELTEPFALLHRS